MRTLPFTFAVLCFLCLTTKASPAAAQTDQRAEERVRESPAPRYLSAIVAELEALSIPHSCEAVTETRARCAFTRRGPLSEREHTVHIVYSDDTDTAYIYVTRLVLAPPDATTTPAVLQRLMELNWALLVGKLEWNAADGEVRLSMVLNTDSNFDRRAFRSLVRQIVPLADRYAGELSQMSTTAE
jgi:hypothetical protein